MARSIDIIKGVLNLDPLMTLLKTKKAELEQLRNDADAYTDADINQELRRTDGVTIAINHQLNWTMLTYKGREDARKLRRI